MKNIVSYHFQIWVIMIFKFTKLLKPVSSDFLYFTLNGSF